MKTHILYPAFIFFYFLASTHISAQKINATLDWIENKHDYHLPGNADILLQNQSIVTKADNATVYTLPVVVHVITTGDTVGSADNPSDARINAMLKTLNNAFIKKGSKYGGVKMNIQFLLAVRTPNNAA